MAGVSSSFKSGSEIHAQADNQVELIGHGLDAIRPNLGIGDAIPNEGEIQVKAFGQFERQRADAVLGGFADLTGRVLAEVFQDSFEAAAKRECGGAFSQRLVGLG